MQEALKTLMQEYIAMQPTSKEQTIKLEINKNERKAAVEYAEASIGLEGFKLNKDEHLRQQRYISGELSLEDLLKSPI